MNNFFKWTGCVFICLGALATSLRVDPLHIYLLNIGTISYLIWSIRIKEKNLIVVNGVVLILYLIGLLNIQIPGFVWQWFLNYAV